MLFDALLSAPRFVEAEFVDSFDPVLSNPSQNTTDGQLLSVEVIRFVQLDDKFT